MMIVCNERGPSRAETLRRLRKLEAEASRKFEKKFGCFEYPERVASTIPFKEQPFGSLADEPAPCRGKYPPTLLSLALFDGDEMLFACTGMTLSDDMSLFQLRRILTSARLVMVFNEKRTRDDNLTIVLRIPGYDDDFLGFIELYDEDIAIVTSLHFPYISPVCLDLNETTLPAGTEVLATGRAFTSSELMVANGKLVEGPNGDDHRCLRTSDCHITEAGLGGPLTDSDQNFVGMNIRCAMGKTWFLPRMLIREHLEQFQILIPRNIGGDYSEEEPEDDMCSTGSSSGTTEISSQGYSPPPGASCIIPSGFARTMKWLDYMGYPRPPPLMLELDGKLIHTFEEPFGYPYPSQGYLIGLICCAEGRNPWLKLGRSVADRISRRVVSLASFKGAARVFACTGMLINYKVAGCYGIVKPSRTVILTSASLVRTCDATDTIDEKLRIEVFLPPNQRVRGTLVAYDSCHNVAIVSAERLHFICPEDALLVDTSDHGWDRQWRKMNREEWKVKRVVSIGRAAEEGILCGSNGVVTREPMTHGCEDLRLSTCKIKKPGIGGPLISLADGSFVGMVLYDKRIRGTPFLPRSCIVKVLRKLELPPSRRAPLRPERTAATRADRALRWHRTVRRGYAEGDARWEERRAAA